MVWQNTLGVPSFIWHGPISLENRLVVDSGIFSVQYASMIINKFPGGLGIKLTTPFELVHNTKPDSKTWSEIFSFGYFNHSIDNIESQSKLQAHTLHGIAVDWEEKSN